MRYSLIPVENRRLFYGAPSQVEMVEALDLELNVNDVIAAYWRRVGDD